MAAKSKSADRATVAAKLVKLLKKEFGSVPKRETLPVLETIIFAICLENAGPDEAMAGFQRLKSSFIDWNEIRVSTISELEPVFLGLPQPEWKAMRIRYFLFYVFDHQYSYDFDALKKKTLELAQKQLQKIKHLTPFVRNYLLLTTLGNHVIPLDRRMVQTAQWLGLLPEGADEEHGAEALKSLVRKSDGPEFFWLLKLLSVSPKIEQALKQHLPPSADELLESADERLADVLAGRKLKALVEEKKPAKETKSEHTSTKSAAASAKTAHAGAKTDSHKAESSKSHAAKDTHAVKPASSSKDKDAQPAKKLTASKPAAPSKSATVTTPAKKTSPQKPAAPPEKKTSSPKKAEPAKKPAAAKPSTAKPAPSKAGSKSSAPARKTDKKKH